MILHAARLESSETKHEGGIERMLRVYSPAI